MVTIDRKGMDRLTAGITSTQPVSGLTHNFYRYPARFSPDFVRSVIHEFSGVGDVVYDPFMGGGTTLVEAASLGRHSVGTDVSSLATFIAQVKTAVFSDKELLNVEAWARAVIPTLTIGTGNSRVRESIRVDYQRNINCRSTWRIRKLLEGGLGAIDLLDRRVEQLLARCILLKTAQWALDCRSEIPAANEFREQAIMNTEEMIDAAHEFSTIMREHNQMPQVLCLQRSVIGAEDDKRLAAAGPPSLILTSPPYPGLHVLYHRWQVRGRKETPAPFWIAGTQDGSGASFYTFGDRKQSSLTRYFETLLAAFRSIHRIADAKTTIVQMVAFSEPDTQLPRYLDTMSKAGFSEVSAPVSDDSPDGRLWRSVPGRKWCARQMGSTGGSQEVVFFHRKT